jgi:hypothetical protein
LNDFNVAGNTLKNVGVLVLVLVLVLLMMSAGLKCLGERQQNLLLNMRKNLSTKKNHNL